jgi:hypothetical protein
MHCSVFHTNEAFCAVTGVWRCNGMVDAQYDVRRSFLWSCAEGPYCVSLKNGIKLISLQERSGIPVILPITKTLAHAALQEIVQHILPRPAPQLLGAQVTQMLYNCSLAVRE